MSLVVGRNKEKYLVAVDIETSERWAGVLLNSYRSKSGRQSSWSSDRGLKYFFFIRANRT
jgi:hypothetical protein